MKSIFTFVKKSAFTLAEVFSPYPAKLRKAAFTLAEVLITLGIVGVVAALTLPTLIQNQQKQVYVSGLKRAYSNISNALNKMAYDEGVTEWRQTNCFTSDPSIYYSERYTECINTIAKQFNNILEKVNYDEPCSKTLTGFWKDEVNPCYSEFPFITSADSVSYLFYCGIEYLLIIDVNGIDKGPNLSGRDIFGFTFDVSNNRLRPFGSDSWDDYEDNCTKANVGN